MKSAREYGQMEDFMTKGNSPEKIKQKILGENLKFKFEACRTESARILMGCGVFVHEKHL